MDKKKEVMDRIGKGALNALEHTEEFFEDIIRREESEKQRSKDITCAVEAFLELKATDSTIINLLHDFFEVDSLSEAKGYIFDAKFNRQKKAFDAYLSEKMGMTEQEIRKYKREHDFYRKLDKRKEYSDYSPEKIKKELDKES